jgi:uncharacterized protein (DUF58 family)
VPTRAGWLVVAGAVVASLAGRALGVLELHLLAAVALAAVVLAVAWVRVPVGSLELRRRIDPVRPTVGGGARCELIVASPRRRTAGLVLHDAVEGTVGATISLPPLVAGTPTTVGFRLPTWRRGLVEVGPLQVRRADPLGLAARTVATLAPSSMLVLPRPELGASALAGAGGREPLAGAAERSLVASGHDDLVTLRPYEVGDDLRRVHWASSAHADELLVRREEERWQGQLTVLVDAREAVDAEGFEEVVSAAAGIVVAAADRGDRARLALTDGTDTHLLDARRGLGQLLEVLALAARHPDAALAVPGSARRGTDAAVLVTADPTGADVLADALRAGGFADVVVVPVRGSR